MSDHALGDAWYVYVWHRFASATPDPTGQLRDAFMAGALAGLQNPGPDAAWEYLAYAASSLKTDGTPLSAESLLSVVHQV